MNPGRKALEALLAFAACAAFGQPVYRCEVKGVVSYSHEPCVGAQVVDTTPTQGLDKSTGRSRKGPDVQRAELQKAMAEATKPITGLDADTFVVRAKRQKLTAAAKLECSALDAKIPSQERDVKAAQGESKPIADAALFQSRKRFRELGC